MPSKLPIDIKPHLSYSQYTNFVGSLGKAGCEAMAVAHILGEWQEEQTKPMLIGSYVDAHFEGTLGVFKAQHPEILKKNGALLGEFVHADAIINRIERDPYFSMCMSGEKQVEMEAEIFGVNWKSRIDSFHPKKAIVDLKVMKSITESKWVKDYGKVSFVEYWGYDIQGAIYREIVRLNTGDTLPFLIAAASKEKIINIEVIGFDDVKFVEVLTEIKCNVDKIQRVKRGEEEPTRCEVCDYCISTKVLTGPVHYSQLITGI